MSMELMGQVDDVQRTKNIAKELGIVPEAKVFRSIHPVMICERVGNKYLLKGTRTNGTAVIDKYVDKDRRIRSSDLPDPGLNFTLSKSDRYLSASKRTVVSLQMVNQPKNVKLFPDVGSDTRSVYFTLPDDEYFLVSLESGEAKEIDLALEIHKLMNDLDVKEDPVFGNYIENKKGSVEVIEWVKDGFRVEFAPVEQGVFKIRTLGIVGGRDKYKIQDLAIKRLLLENKEIRKIIGFDGEVIEIG